MITKEALERHGGTIVYQSVEGRGTTFVVTLPLSSAANTPDSDPIGADPVDDVQPR